MRKKGLTNEALESIRSILEDIGLTTDYESHPKSAVEIPAVNGKLMSRSHLEGSQVLSYVKDGILYLSESNRRNIYTSENGLESSEVLLNIPEATDLSGAVLVSSTNRIVACDSDGNVFVSNETQDDYEKVFTFSAGYPHKHLGWSQYKNVILLGTYGRSVDYADDNPPRQVLASRDSGETWEIIFDMPVDEIKEPHRYHIHHVAYDPYADRVFIALGDLSNQNILYSNDFGGTWNEVFKEQELSSSRQTTQILPFPKGIILASDSTPEGLHFIPRKKGILRPEITAKDLITDQLLFDDKGNFNMFAVTSWQHWGDEKFTLLPFTLERKQDESRSSLLFTRDGINWSEIYRYNNYESGFQNVMYDDVNDKIYGFFIAREAYFFVADMPSFT